MAPAGYQPLKSDLDDSLELSTAPRSSRALRSRRFFLSTLALLGVVGISAFYALSGPRDAHYAAEAWRDGPDAPGILVGGGPDGPSERLQKCRENQGHSHWAKQPAVAASQPHT